jgi:hypothetical protein
MRSYFVILIFIAIIPFSWSQKMEKQFIEFNGVALYKVIRDVEIKFDVKYSYGDSIVNSVEITLKPQEYLLDEINSAIENQTSLKIISINKRYFSIIKEIEVPVKAEQLKEILVEGFLSKGINKLNQNILIYPQKVTMLPGVTDADILLSLQQLPGVKSPNETTTGLNIRGGSADQNLILWDGVRIYHPGHLFGMISGFNPNVVSKVLYQNKATHPKFGERVASVIEIQSIDSIATKTHVNAGVNGLNTDVFLQTPLLRNSIGLQLSGRKSYTEFFQTPTFDALEDKVFQNTNLENFDDSNQFGFEDYAAKLNFRLSTNSEIALSGIWIDNNLDFTSLSSNQKEKNQKMNIANQGYSLNWTQKYSSKFKQFVLIHYSAYQFAYDKNEVKTATTFELFQKRNRITDSGVHCNFEWKPSNILQFDFGYQRQGNDISHAYTSKNQDLEIDLNQKQLFLISNVGFANMSVAVNSWKFIAGIRYNSVAKLNSNLIEPRLLIQKKLVKDLTAQFSYEKKNQIVSQFRESVANDLSLENYIWILSDNSQYPIQKAQQYTAGLVYKNQSWLFDLDVYYKTIRGITSLTFGFLNPVDAEPHRGEGFTKGADVLVQKSEATWRAWLTYTFQDSQNKFDAIDDTNYFATNANIRHAFSASFYKKWNKYSLAIGWFWRTGKPYSLLNDSNQIVSFNSEQLPSYHRADISGMYHFHNERSWSGKVGVSIYNAYNRRTVISREYERQYSSIADIVNTSFKVQDYSSLGIMPNIFLRFNF